MVCFRHFLTGSQIASHQSKWTIPGSAGMSGLHLGTPLSGRTASRVCRPCRLQQLLVGSIILTIKYGVVEVAGPERFRFDEPVRFSLRARGDQREVVADQKAQYFGAV